MKYIPIDSYGSCLHNKDFPSLINIFKFFFLFNILEQISNHDFINFFIQLISEYKFFLVLEEINLTDFVTERLMISFQVIIYFYIFTIKKGWNYSYL